MSGIKNRRLKKNLFLALTLIGAALAWGQDECGVYLDVLQTRDPGSIIDVQGEGYIDSTSSQGCELNTTDVSQGFWWPHLECGTGTASATGIPAASLDVNYSFTADTAVTSATPCSDNSNSCQTATANSGDITLNQSGYASISQPYGGATYHFTAKGDKYIDSITLTVDTDTNLSFENQTGAALEIGNLYSQGKGSLYMELDGPASYIKINSLSFNNYTKMNLEATQAIEIGTLTFPRYNSVLVLKAPKVVINNLTQSNSGDYNSTIIIYADEIDVNGTMNLGQEANLYIHPYTPGNRVLVKAGAIISSSSSSIITDSADIYTDRFDIPGTSSSASIRASDANQIVNLYINGDFAPGNNPGINTVTDQPNYFNLPAANFRMFVNGDFNIGSGGTAFNALIYVEGSTTLGTDLILNGALSSGGNIITNENDHFSWDPSIDNLGGVLCNKTSTALPYYNKYYCGLFDTPLNAWGSINLNGPEHHKYRFRHCWRVRTQAMNGDHGCYPDDQTETECQILPPPPNRAYYENMYGTTDTSTQTFSTDVNLTDAEYGNLIFTGTGQNVVFDPQQAYKDNQDVHYMLAGDVNFTGSDQNWTLKSGDYFFNSLNMENPVNVCVEGPVRIFVHGDMNWQGNLDSNCSGEVFIYVGGDAEVTTFAEESSVPVYLYCKGDAHIHKCHDCDEGHWHGAITCEGDINVDDDDIDFDYDANGAELLGYGDCKICYGPIKESGFGVTTPIGSVGFLGTITTPIYASSTLKDVKIEELHNASIFNFNFGSKYEVIDQNGTEVRPATTETSGFYAAGFGMDMTMFGNKAVLYELGDSNFTYGPTTPTNYQQLYSEYLFSFDFTLWKDSLVYYGQYTDTEGRQYQLIVNPCAPNENISLTPVTGFFDAWDDDYTYATVAPNPDANGIPTNRVITTKIYHDKNGFKIDAAFIPNSPVPAVASSDGVIEADIALVRMNNGSFDPHNGLISDWGYYKYNPASPVQTYTFQYGITTSGNNVSLKDVGAVPDARVVFKVCADYNGQQYTIYPLESCEEVGDCDTVDQQNSICYRYFTSSDDFAIRPYGLRLFGKNEYRRAGEEFNLTIKAVDEDNYEATKGTIDDVAAVPGYDVNISDLQFNPVMYQATETEKDQMRRDMGLPADAQVDYCPNAGTFEIVNSGDTFSNGELNATLKYSEVGILELNLTEKPGYEFAKVDEDDTVAGRLYMAPSNGITDMDDISKKDLLLIIPYKFVTTGDVTTTFGTPWVYISRDVNNSNSTFTTPKVGAVASFHIVAQNKDGQIVRNFTKTCFPDFQITAPAVNGLKLNVTFDLFLDTHLRTSVPVANMAFYTEDGNGTAIYTPNKVVNLPAGDSVVKEWISSLNFENGEADAKVYFNQIKDYSTPVDAYTVEVMDLNTSTSWMNNPGATRVFIPALLNKSIEFRYGRLKVDNISTYGNEITTSWLYQYYKGGDWVTNTDHITTQMGHFYTDKSILGDVEINELAFDKGVSQVKLSTNHSLPYSYKVHLAIDPWLWYNPKATKYLDPITATGNNYDCLTHPCFIIEFMENNSGWGGVENQQLNQKGLGTQQNTVQLKKDNNGTQQHFQRLNW